MNRRADARAGYHSWPADGGGFVGSFEVFWSDGSPSGPVEGDGGWFWWACFPGCLPDGEPMGPFDTSSLAFEDAMAQEG